MVFNEIRAAFLMSEISKLQDFTLSCAINFVGKAIRRPTIKIIINYIIIGMFKMNFHSIFFTVERSSP